MRALVAVVLCAVLAACGSDSVYSDWSKEETASMADVANANARTALMRVDEVETKVASLQRLEDEIEALEAKVRSLEGDIEALEYEYRSHTHGY